MSSGYNQSHPISYRLTTIMKLPYTETITEPPWDLLSTPTLTSGQPSKPWTLSVATLWSTKILSWQTDIKVYTPLFSIPFTLWPHKLQPPTLYTYRLLSTQVELPTRLWNSNLIIWVCRASKLPMETSSPAICPLSSPPFRARHLHHDAEDTPTDLTKILLWLLE